MALSQIIASRQWAFVLGIGLWVGSIIIPDAEAAPSIRVLLASDVQQLEVLSEQPIWVTDRHNEAWSYRSALQIKVQGRALLLNGKPVVTDQLTLKAGTHDLKLWITKIGNQAVRHASDEKDVLQVSGAIKLIRKGKGLHVINLPVPFI